MFGTVKLTKHVDIDLCKYSGYSIGFDRKGFFSIGDEVGRNVISSGVDMSLSSHIDNKNKDILILGKGPTQALEHTLAAEKLYSINFTKQNTKFCITIEQTVYLFVNNNLSGLFRGLLWGVCVGGGGEGGGMGGIKSPPI